MLAKLFGAKNFGLNSVGLLRVLVVCVVWEK